MDTCPCQATDTECVECRKERWRSIGLSQTATPSRRLTKGAPPAGPMNSWERGIPTDERGVPFLDDQGHPVGQKEFSENRRRWRRASRESIQVNPPSSKD